MTDAEIAGYMGWRGPGAYTAASMRKIKHVIAEAENREREACALIVCPVPHVEEERECSDIAAAIRMRSNV